MMAIEVKNTGTKIYKEKQIKIFEKVKETYVVNQCKLISTIDDYVDRNSLMKFQCFCGNIACKSFQNFKNSPRCNSKEFNCRTEKKNQGLTKRLEEQKEFFKKYNCILLEEKYKKNDEKLSYLCSCGEEDSKKFDSFKNIPHCNKCKGITSIEDMEKKYLENGCKLIGKMKLTRGSRYSFICSCGEEDSKTYMNFENNPRCNKCDVLHQLILTEKKYTDRGAILLSKKEYMESSRNLDDPTPLLFKCQCGNDKCEKTISTFLDFPYCDKCSSIIRERANKNKIIPFEETKAFIESYGYTVTITEKEYINSTEKIPALCPRLHPCQITKKGLIKGSTCCVECGKINRDNTMIELYGAANAMHCPEFLEKATKNSLSYKVYTFPSGNKVLFQGYENYCLDELINAGIKEEEIVTQFDREKENGKRKIPIIEYQFENKFRKYYPDFYISHLNLIIEVKSQYTFDLHIEKNLAKMTACKEQGYNFQFWFYNGKGEKIKVL